jgi:hypothetical protein
MMPTSPGRQAEVLSLRALNRATLERQLLLRRRRMPALAAVHHLGGLQAQLPNSPYIGLLARLDGFAVEELSRLIHDREVVRAVLLRATQHLSTAADFLSLRPLLQPVLDRGRQAAMGRLTAGVDLAELAATGRALLRGRTLTRPQLRALLAERWPDRDPDALAWSVQYLVPLVHVPPGITWRTGGVVRCALAEDWLGRPLPESPSMDSLIHRHLAAFGPATTADMQTWSGLRRLDAAVERLRPQLRVHRDEAGRELFDLPGAPLPDEDIPAPPRFLPEFDNLMIAHADRTRVMTGAHRRRVITGSMVRATLLVDGFVRGTWTIKRERSTATLTVELFAPLAAHDQASVAEEGARLLTFTSPDADDHQIRFTPAGKPGTQRTSLR